MALVATGGYGRAELSPHSDVDLVVLYKGRRPPDRTALRALLYPLWDAGFQVGHALLTPRAAVERSATDLHAATALLSVRHVVGDETLFEELIARRDRWTTRERKGFVRRILREVADRHVAVDRAGWALAPDIKSDVGGLRDAHALDWLARIAGSEPPDAVRDAAGTLLAVREALHGEVKRRTDRVRMDLQGAIARRLQVTPDELMTEVHSSARTIEHRGGLESEALSEALIGGPRRSGSIHRIALDVRVEDGVLSLDASADHGVAGPLRLLAARAEKEHAVDRASLERMRALFTREPIRRWDAEVRRAFFVLLSGPHSAASLEILDHLGGWSCLLPEWTRARGRAQYDPYHRFTVDGHSYLAVQEATRLIGGGDPVATTAAQEAGNLKPLYAAMLLHDVGKGSAEDHSVAGAAIARRACDRMGLRPDETDEVCALVRWHLLLSDTATRRDLDDGAVIGSVAETIGDARLLRLLYILSAADGIATGPEAWNGWKQALVRELYRKTLIALEKGDLPARRDVAARAGEVEAYEPTLAGRAAAVLSTLPPSYLEATAIPDMVDDVRLLLDPPAPGEVRWRIDTGTEAGQAALTACVPDRPGALARTAGTFALNRISILRSQAYSTSDGVALQRFVVQAPEGSWKPFVDSLGAAYSGRLALEAELERKARAYRPSTAVAPEVRILQDASPHSTVVEVRAVDALGLLYAIAAALGDLDLDIHVAKIDTLGDRVVDVFYVRTPWGTKLSGEQEAAVEPAIRHRVRRLLG